MRVAAVSHRIQQQSATGRWRAGGAPPGGRAPAATSRGNLRVRLGGIAKYGGHYHLKKMCHHSTEKSRILRALTCPLITFVGHSEVACRGAWHVRGAPRPTPQCHHAMWPSLKMHPATPRNVSYLGLTKWTAYGEPIVYSCTKVDGQNAFCPLFFRTAVHN